MKSAETTTTLAEDLKKRLAALESVRNRNVTRVLTVREQLKNAEEQLASVQGAISELQTVIAMIPPEPTPPKP